MDAAIIIARLLHVLTGIFWVGAMLFMTAFLVPSIAEAGPDGAKVMAGLTRRKFMLILPVVAVVTILSGIWLYWRVSSGFNGVYLRSGPGHTYGIGGILAIIAFGIGVTVTRPAMMKAAALSQSAMNASPGERDALMARAQQLRMRSAKGGKVVAWLLALSAVTMAVGRYV